MKRNINDYKDTKTAIEVNSIKEFDKIKKLLGHTKQKGKRCFKDNKNYISCYSDDYCDKQYWINAGFTLYKASDFLEEEFKFKEGKWYYIELDIHKHYLKFKKINKNNAFLDKEGYIKNLKEWDYGCSINIKEVTFYRLLTDLSEIQEFLPDGHIDKIKTEIIPEYVECIKADIYIQIGNVYKVQLEKGFTYNLEKVYFINNNPYYQDYFKQSTREAYKAQNKQKQLTVDDLIKGEIYVFDINSTKNFISKFDYIESDNYYDSCFIQGDDFDNDPEFATISDIKSIRLATNEEKKWLNTCISQDKFISKEDLHLYDDSGLLIWEIGCYYKLNFTDNTSTYIKLSKKVDDRIYGNEYTDSTGKWYYNEIIWSTKQLKTHEKVDKPDQKIKDMFKKDDYIYVLGGETTTGKNCKDKVLKIESVDLKSLNKPFVTTDYDECGGIYFDEIRMATATEINTLYIHKKEEQDMKSILAEAKERYPIGTKFKSVVTRNLFTVESHVNEANNSNIAFHTIESNSSGNHWGCVYEKGTWAEIISLPNEIPITSNCILYNGENISKSFEVSQYYEFDGKSFNQDIYIAPITKKTKKLQTITIESTTDLNLNLTKIKSKQIQTIKI